MRGWLNGEDATVVDLFAGTGGMGLASLLAEPLQGRSKIVFTGELDPGHVSMIRQNYDFYANKIGELSHLPPCVESSDLSSELAVRKLDKISRYYGGVTLLLAGPPCQGFSSSNRKSRDRQNPLNRIALEVVDLIRVASPKIAIIENVPGIRSMPSARNVHLSVSEHIEQQLSDLGYYASTHLLNAADYGVPQHRLRSFTLAISHDIQSRLGIRSLVPNPQYGPGRPRPYRTVREAISDLPSIDNGAMVLKTRYPSPPQSRFQREVRGYSQYIFDHIATKHSARVIDRFEAIPPGGNWKSIRRKLSNYSAPENTHHNIYRRLVDSEPSITIGNFRKAMTVHPWQHRGLSLREAARLQSLPDWLRFFPDEPEIYRGSPRGMSYRQQQIGNAVCFMLTKKLIAHLFSKA